MNQSLALVFVSLAWFNGISALNLSRPNIRTEDSASFGRATFSNSNVADHRNIFSPRMDYDEWTPLGRGDPLKNDPTYDYVPPVLDRVHYWMDPSKRTPDPPVPNSGLMVLGPTTEYSVRATTSTSRYPTQEADKRLDSTSLLDPFFRLMDPLAMNFGSNVHYKPAGNRIHRPLYQGGSKQKTQAPQALQRPPYTMLMPPPPPPSISHTATSFVSLAPTTMFNEFPRTTTFSPPPSSSPAAPKDVSNSPKNVTTINPKVNADTENVFKPVAISMPQQTTKNGQGFATGNGFRAPPTQEPVLPIVTLFDKTSVRGAENKFKSTGNLNEILGRETLPKVRSPESTGNGLERNSSSAKESRFSAGTRPPIGRYPETAVSTLRATTAPTVTPAKASSPPTTDPSPKGRKQPPSGPKQGGPFYLIIQGHSKVKTYGARKNPVNRLVTNNEIRYDEEDNGGKGRKVEKRSLRLPRSLTQNADSSEDEKLDLESLIAVNDDYDSAEVSQILKQETSGSGSGELTGFGIFGKSVTSNDEI